MDPTYTLTPTLFPARLLSPDRIRARRQLEKMRQQTNGQQRKGIWSNNNKKQMENNNNNNKMEKNNQMGNAKHK